jgi:S-formylglutathione hydrolase FrmB
VASPTGHQPFTAVPTDVGRLVVTRLTGERSGVSLRVWVWLPPQYDQPGYAHTSFPALMLYPGGSGAGYNTWAGVQYHAKEEDAAGAATGRLTPFVFVMPEMQAREHLDTECADLPGQPRIGTFLAVDVRRMVQDNFRVLPDRTGWAAAGASSGAYCATRLVFGHPDQYAAVVSIAGYFTIETTLPGSDDPAVRALDPAAIASSSPPPVSVLLWAGGSDGVDLRDARGFLAKIRAPTSAELRILPRGRHLTRDFARMMPDSLAFLSAHLAHPTTIP